MIIIIILALLALRYIDVGRSEKHYIWILNYAQQLLAWLQRRSIKNTAVLLILLILPFLAVVYILANLAMYWGLWLIEFIADLFLLWYALWPISNRQLEVEGFTIVKETDVPTIMIDQHGKLFNHNTSQQQCREYSKRLLIEANQNTFAVIFWFVIFGGYGAIIYRFINLLYRHANESAELTELRTLLTLLQQGLDWIPARLVSITYTLAGDFVPGFHSWRRYASKNFAANDDLLVNTGLSAAGKNFNDFSKADAEENHQLIRLIDRALMIWLIWLFMIRFIITIFVPS